jgi:transcriptional regulator with XRE-family HTH domain
MHTRGLTQAKLAALTGINRTVLARILTNEPGRGKETRHKIFPHLLPAEIELLGWENEFTAWQRQNTAWNGWKSSTQNIVPDQTT